VKSGEEFSSARAVIEHREPTYTIFMPWRSYLTRTRGPDDGESESPPATDAPRFSSLCLCSPMQHGGGFVCFSSMVEGGRQAEHFILRTRPIPSRQRWSERNDRQSPRALVTNREPGTLGEADPHV
jgi:hypothetical protein